MTQLNLIVHYKEVLKRGRFNILPGFIRMCVASLNVFHIARFKCCNSSNGGEMHFIILFILQLDLHSPVLYTQECNIRMSYV